MIRPHRNHPAYWAFVLHRVSGLLLAIFLPLHFLTLGLALEAAALESFLRWSAHTPVKLAEAGLVILLAAHLTGGLRLLAIEFLPWPARPKALIAAATGLAVGAGALFLLSVFLAPTV